MDRIFARDREAETETDNCKVGSVQLANKIAARNRCAKRVVTANIAKTREDHDLRKEKRISQQRACGNSDESPLCPVQANSNHIMKMLLAAEKSNPDLNHPRYNYPPGEWNKIQSKRKKKRDKNRHNQEKRKSSKVKLPPHKPAASIHKKDLKNRQTSKLNPKSTIKLRAEKGKTIKASMETRKSNELSHVLKNKAENIPSRNWAELYSFQTLSSPERVHLKTVLSTIEEGSEFSEEDLKISVDKITRAGDENTSRRENRNIVDDKYDEECDNCELTEFSSDGKKSSAREDEEKDDNDKFAEQTNGKNRGGNRDDRRNGGNTERREKSAMQNDETGMHDDVTTNNIHSRPKNPSKIAQKIRMEEANKMKDKNKNNNNLDNDDKRDERKGDGDKQTNENKDKDNDNNRDDRKGDGGKNTKRNKEHDKEVEYIVRTNERAGTFPVYNKDVAIHPENQKRKTIIFLAPKRSGCGMKIDREALALLHMITQIFEAQKQQKRQFFLHSDPAPEYFPPPNIIPAQPKLSILAKYPKSRANTDSNSKKYQSQNLSPQYLFPPNIETRVDGGYSNSKPKTETERQKLKRDSEQTHINTIGFRIHVHGDHLSPQYLHPPNLTRTVKTNLIKTPTEVERYYYVSQARAHGDHLSPQYLHPPNPSSTHGYMIKVPTPWIIPGNAHHQAEQTLSPQYLFPPNPRNIVAENTEYSKQGVTPASNHEVEQKLSPQYPPPPQFME